jgi:hypothetical protein
MMCFFYYITHRFFFRINGYTNDEVSMALETFKLPANERRPRVKDKLFPLLDASIGEANTHLMSFVFVRHPVIRLISAYEQRLVRNWAKHVGDQDDQDMHNTILKRYYHGSLQCTYVFQRLG